MHDLNNETNFYIKSKTNVDNELMKEKIYLEVLSIKLLYPAMNVIINH